MLSWHYSSGLRMIFVGLGWEKGGVGMVLVREQEGRRGEGRGEAEEEYILGAPCIAQAGLELTL